jgi:hypothetical protein
MLMMPVCILQMVVLAQRMILIRLILINAREEEQVQAPSLGKIVNSPLNRVAPEQARVLPY